MLFPGHPHLKETFREFYKWWWWWEGTSQSCPAFSELKIPHASMVRTYRGFDPYQKKWRAGHGCFRGPGTIGAMPGWSTCAAPPASAAWCRGGGCCRAPVCCERCILSCFSKLVFGGRKKFLRYYWHLSMVPLWSLRGWHSSVCGTPGGATLLTVSPHQN